MTGYRVARTLFGVWLATILAAAAGAAEVAIPALDFTVRLDPASRQLRGAGTITLPAGGPVTVVLDPRFAIAELAETGRPVQATRDPTSGELSWTLQNADSKRMLTVQWQGLLEPLDGALNHRQTLTAAAPVTSPEGSFLPSAGGWYPAVRGTLFTYRVTIELPAGQRGLTGGTLVAEQDDASGYRATFAFRHPAEGIDLMAGPYRIVERFADSVDGRALRLRTWFLPGLEDLAGPYLESVAGYLARYERWIGPYPYDGFSVVASPTPTGFGMPTLTYLGADVLRLPFIRATSLGHEVLHNWWGNGVYPDYRRGNWSEGLTTFMADYHARELQGPDAARDARYEWLRDVSALAPSDAKPLTTFTARTHGASQILGYQRAAMVFLMLRDRIGEAAFDRGLRAFWAGHRFDFASWDDLRAAMEGASGQGLAGFFDQWIGQAGIPQPGIVAAVTRREERGWRLDVTLAPETGAFELDIPFRVRTDKGESLHTARVRRGGKSVTIDVTDTPLGITLDPDARLLRRLLPGESPPILREVMVAARPGIRVLSDLPAFTAAARAVASRLLDATASVSEVDGPLTGPTLVFGSRREVDTFLAKHALPDVRPQGAQSAPAVAWVVRSRGQPVLVVTAEDAAALQALGRPLPHYGRQSWVVFDGTRVAARGIWPAAPREIPVDHVEAPAAR